MTNHFGHVVGQRTTSDGKELTAIDCAVCKFIHLNPIPQDDPYSDGRYHRETKPDYRKEYDEDAGWWSATYGDWLELILRNTQRITLLDVGAGTGHFVREARGWHFRSYGIEPDRNMAEADAWITATEYSQWGTDGYGTVSANFVMEHLPDPNHFLQWTRERLVKDGLLLATIPNDFSVMQQKVMDEALLSVPSYYWLNEHHVNYWNNTSFTQLLERNGYEVLARYGSWEPEFHLLAGQNYLSDHTLGRWLHRNRMLDDLKMTREERLKKYLQLGSEGRGRDLTFLARKI